MATRIEAAALRGWRGLALALCLMLSLVLGLPVAARAQGAQGAQGTLVELPTRPGVQTRYWWMPTPGASATVLLFSGGAGGIGLQDGVPQSGNFLLRSRDAFAQAGLNVALVDNPSDMPRITPAFRQSKEHLEDVRATILHILQTSKAPVWLVGTSEGTISAAAVAVGLGPLVQGLVLTSSLTGRQFGGSLSTMNLEPLQVPVLVYQHQRDACMLTPGYLARALLEKMPHAPVKKYWEVDGGGEPRGNPCGPFHYHGFIHIEAQAVQQITGWMRAPSN